MTRLLAPVEGDILDDGSVGNTSRALSGQKNTQHFGITLWPKVDGNVVIPYAFNDSIPKKARADVAAAIEHFASQTCVRFVPRTHEKSYLHISPGEGCHGDVGRGNAAQAREVILDRECAVENVIHAFMHSLGFLHEFSRPDRDQYVRIQEKNVAPGLMSQFVICANCQTLGLPYDYESIMHYGKAAFSKDRRAITILPLNSSKLDRMGKSTRLSPLDVKRVNTAYQCE